MKMFLHILGTLPFIERTQKDLCISLKKLAQESVRFALDLVTFGDVLPGRFQPYVCCYFLAQGQSQPKASDKTNQYWVPANQVQVPVWSGGYRRRVGGGSEAGQEEKIEYKGEKLKLKIKRQAQIMFQCSCFYTKPDVITKNVTKWKKG